MREESEKGSMRTRRNREHSHEDPKGGQMGEADATRNEFGRLLADMDFLEMDLWFRSPNVFSIFQMEYVGPKLSAFLAWLLNPNAEHGLGDEFLRRFLSAALAGKPPDRDKPPEGLSPIPYEAVQEKLIGWDLLDVLAADLRETNVTTDFRRKADGGRIDICLWNDSYNIAVYVENWISPRHYWRIRQGSGVQLPERDSERYLLDLFAQWGCEEAGGYEILPVFLSLKDTVSRETRCFHNMTYHWMPAFLEPLAKASTISPQAVHLITDFCHWLRWEMPAELDPDLHDRLARLTGQYGRTVCRLVEHVNQCSGCEEDDTVAAYHDVYRRHGATLERLARFAEGMDYKLIDKIKRRIEKELDPELMTYQQGPSTLSAFCRRWERSAGQYAAQGVQVYVSACSATCGIMVHTDPLGDEMERILQAADDVAEEQKLIIGRPVRSMRNFNLLRFSYDQMTIEEASSDFVRCCRFLDEVYSRLK